MDHDYCKLSNEETTCATSTLAVKSHHDGTRTSGYESSNKSDTSHITTLTTLANDSELNEKSKRNWCDTCGKSFSKASNLRRHCKNLHCDLRKVFKYKCDRCHRQFNQPHRLRSHIRKDHIPNIPFPTKKHSCFVCQQSFTKKDLLKHLSDEHNVPMHTEKLSFPSLEDFQQWKTKMEESSQCYYKVERGLQETENGKLHSYVCHRSGYFLPKGFKVRKMKSQGSKKINSICPSNIRVVEAADGGCSVMFVKTHMGHEQELEHLYLTQAEREALAEKISAKLSFDEILEEVRNAPANSTTGRIRRITKKDLQNIVAREKKRLLSRDSCT